VEAFFILFPFQRKFFNTKKGETIMATKKSIVFLFALLLISGLVLGSSPLNPAECADQVYDVNPCVACVSKPYIQSPEITIFAGDCKGIMRSNIENKIFDNVTVHSQGVMMMEGKMVTSTFYMKYLDRDGDFVIFLFKQNPGETSATTTILGGTGKWKGITGGGKATLITQGKPVTPDSNQFCNNHKGSFTLPK
jgi:hypothetical protein